MALHVVVVDDHSFTRSTVSASLRQNNFNVVAEVENALDAVQAVIQHKPDAVVIDLNLGEGPSGIDLARGLRKNHPNLGIVLLTSYADPRLFADNLPEMPVGTQYLVKQDLEDAQALADAVNASVGNTSKRNADPETRLPLTDSQTDVFRLLAEGLSNAEIAKRRGVKEKAVEQTLGRIAKRLDVQTDGTTNLRAQLVKTFYRLTGSQRGR